MVLGTTNSITERLVARLVPSRYHDARPHRLLCRTVRALSGCVAVSALCYVLLVALLMAALRLVGERCWWLWPLLFMPPQLALLPLAVLGPLGLLLCPRSLVADGIAAGLVLGVYMGWGWPRTKSPDRAPAIVVMSCNMGQRNNARLTPFIESQDPDLIALQDVAYRGGRYARQYPGRHVEARGEFILISRVPILSADLVEEVRWGHQPVAARFELDWDGLPLVLYNVHMPSPRRELERLMGLGLAKEWARSYGWFGARPGTGVAAGLESRTDLARALRRRIDAEPSPVIVAGDLNMPHWGYTYNSVVMERLSDAYAERGGGCGFTFPGYSRNPLTLFGPWLRLDYILCSDGLRPCAAKVEPSGRAQHRAISAQLCLDR